MAIISFISTQLVQTYPQSTDAHILIQHSLCNRSTGLSLLSVRLYLLQKEMSLLWGVQWQNAKGDTQIQQERDKKTKREEETGRRGKRRIKLSQIAFFLHLFETDLYCYSFPSHRLWDITLRSDSRRSDSNSTICPSVTVTGRALLWQDILIIRFADVS